MSGIMNLDAGASGSTAGGGDTAPSFDSSHFQRVVGYLPMGVAIVSGRDSDGAPAGVAVGSFTAVSFEPPIVTFCVYRTSASWAKMRDQEKFCVNVLSKDQASVCDSFARKGGRKFEGIAWQASEANGMPRLDGAHAWVDCELAGELVIGDHVVVACRVIDLDVSGTSAALVFYRGNFAPMELQLPWC
jgi:3-hydroxy-9,10-secoandrosta-1,3,5(10)-triene-9,17-dione monooxygenase reductase component